MCCVFDSVCEFFWETIRNILGVVAILLLNVMDVFSVGGGALLIYRVWYSKECACFSCDPNVHLSVPSIGFCMSEVISSFKSWITGVCSPYVVSLCDIAYYVVR